MTRIVSVDRSVTRSVERSVDRSVERVSIGSPTYLRTKKELTTHLPAKSSSELTRENDSCVCGHHRRLHGPTRCHWLDCGCLTFDSEQVRR